MFVRHPHNPLIVPAMVKPSRPDFEVIGAFNAGATLYEGEVLLLVRVAERPAALPDGWVRCPYYTPEGELEVRHVARADPAWDASDPRLARNRATGELLLTSVSHLRLARSRDGVHFSVAGQPWLTPAPPYESFGLEDPRITRLGGMYYVNYTAVSPHGIATALISTPDFVHITRHGIIFPPDNRDVTLFPEQVGSRYICYHRPMPGMFRRMSIWLATSPDLHHWGDSRLVLGGRQGQWDAGRVGGGAPPILTERGWLAIYHGADERNLMASSVARNPFVDIIPSLGVKPQTDRVARGFNVCILLFGRPVHVIPSCPGAFLVVPCFLRKLARICLYNAQLSCQCRFCGGFLFKTFILNRLSRIGVQAPLDFRVRKVSRIQILNWPSVQYLDRRCKSLLILWIFKRGFVRRKGNFEG